MGRNITIEEAITNADGEDVNSSYSYNLFVKPELITSIAHFLNSIAISLLILKPIDITISLL